MTYVPYPEYSTSFTSTRDHQHYLCTSCMLKAFLAILHFECKKIIHATMYTQLVDNALREPFTTHTVLPRFGQTSGFCNTACKSCKGSALVCLNPRLGSGSCATIMRAFASATCTFSFPCPREDNYSQYISYTVGSWYLPVQRTRNETIIFGCPSPTQEDTNNDGRTEPGSLFRTRPMYPFYFRKP